MNQEFLWRKPQVSKAVLNVAFGCIKIYLFTVFILSLG